MVRNQAIFPIAGAPSQMGLFWPAGIPALVSVRGPGPAHMPDQIVIGDGATSWLVDRAEVFAIPSVPLACISPLIGRA